MDRAKKGKQEAAKKVSLSDELIFLLCKTNNHNVFFEIHSCICCCLKTHLNIRRKSLF